MKPKSLQLAKECLRHYSVDMTAAEYQEIGKRLKAKERVAIYFDNNNKLVKTKPLAGIGPELEVWHESTAFDQISDAEISEGLLKMPTHAN